MKRGHYEEDQFQSTLHKAMKYVMRHRDIAIIVVAVIVIGGGLLIYSLSKGETQNPEADMLHTQAMGLISMGRLEEAAQTLLDLTSRFKGTRSGKIGLYYLAVIYYHTGQFEDALEYFNEFLNVTRNDYLLTPAAHFGAACAAEGVKDYEQAYEHYEKLVKDEESPFYFPAMLSYARVSGLLGDKEKARELLQDLLDKRPPADIAMDAQFYIGFFSE
jgi:tetratricopeptide (TPR) repeat protein